MSLTINIHILLSFYHVKVSDHPSGFWFSLFDDEAFLIMRNTHCVISFQCQTVQRPSGAWN